METLKFKSVVFWGPAFLFPKAQPTKINFPRPIQIYFPRPSPPKQNPPPLPQGGEGAYKFIFWGPVHQQKLNQCLRLLIQNRHLRFLFLATHHLFFFCRSQKPNVYRWLFFSLKGHLMRKTRLNFYFVVLILIIRTLKNRRQTLGKGWWGKTHGPIPKHQARNPSEGPGPRTQPN